jgi:hypothetical protein
MKRATIEVTHAIEEESGLIVALTEKGNLYVLGKSMKSKIATRLGEEWFDGSKANLESYRNQVIEKSSPELTAEVNKKKQYQNQLWELLSEDTHLAQEI